MTAIESKCRKTNWFGSSQSGLLLSYLVTTITRFRFELKNELVRREYIHYNWSYNRRYDSEISMEILCLNEREIAAMPV